LDLSLQHFDRSVHNTTADEMDQYRVCPALLLAPWLWSLFVQLAGGSPCPTGCPTSSSRICRGDSSLDSTMIPLCSVCSANSDPAGAHPQGMLCLDAQQMSLATEGSHGPHRDNLAGWSLQCLAASLFTDRTPEGVWEMGLRGQEPPTQHCIRLVWGMPGRPGPGFRLRCVQSVSVTW
jgi:hypothetical protein